MAKDIGRFRGVLARMFDNMPSQHAENLANDLISLLENKDRFYDKEQFREVVYNMCRQGGG